MPAFCYGFTLRKSAIETAAYFCSENGDIFPKLFSMALPIESILDLAATYCLWGKIGAFCIKLWEDAMKFRSTFGAIIALSLTMSAHAETRIEKKLMQFGGPETRTRCIGNLKTKGIPACTVRGWNLTCEDTWIETCTQWATDFQQHEIFLVVTGPDAPNALENVLRNALERSLLAAVSAAIAVPGEVAAKTAAAIAAFKITLYAELAIEPALAAMKDQFQISISDKSHW